MGRLVPEPPALPRRLLAVALLTLGVPLLRGAEVAPAPRPVVRPVTPELRKALRLDPFYAKAADYRGLPILGSAKVPDAALAEARYLIGRMLADRDDVVRALVKPTAASS
jgi:hypothetical protein